MRLQCLPLGQVLAMFCLLSMVHSQGATQPRHLRSSHKDFPLSYQIASCVFAIMGLCFLLCLKASLDNCRRIDRHRRAGECLAAKHARGEASAQMLPRCVILPSADAARVNRCPTDSVRRDKLSKTFWICDMCGKRCEDPQERFERCATCQLNICSSCAAAGSGSGDKSYESASGSESVIECLGLGEHNCLWRIVIGTIAMLTIIGACVGFALAFT